MAQTNVTFRLRRDTSANWRTTNSTLSAGEPGIETDTGRIKIGNGSTSWNSLPYVEAYGNNTINILDYGARPDYVSGAIPGTNSIAPIDNAKNAAETAGLTYPRTLVMPPGNYNYTKEPFDIPNNSATIQEYGNILTANTATPFQVSMRIPERIGSEISVSSASGSGTIHTYFCSNTFKENDKVAVRGMLPDGFNLTNATILTANSTQFTTAGTLSGNSTRAGTVAIDLRGTGNLYYKTYSDGAARNTEYTGRVISGPMRAGTQGGNLGGANGTAMNMFDIRYDNAYVGDQVTVTLSNIPTSSTMTVTTSDTKTLTDGQPIIFNTSISSAIIAGTVYYIHSPSGSPTTTISVRTTISGTSPINTLPIGVSSVIARANIGNGVIHAVQGRTVLNSSENGGGRIATSGYVLQNAISSRGSTNRNYVGVGGFSVTANGDGGTDLSREGSRGAYFGGNFIAKADGGPNIFNLCGTEINVENRGTATARYVQGVTSVGGVTTPGNSVTASYTVGGLSEGGCVHNGWKHGLLFTNLNGREPMTTDGTLIGTYWELNSALRRTIGRGIDIRFFRPTTSVIETPNSTLTETSISLGVPSAANPTTTISTNGQYYSSATPSDYSLSPDNNATTTLDNANISVASRGSGSVHLTDGSGTPVNRISINSATGINMRPVLNPSLSLANGDMNISINSGQTGVVLTYRTDSGILRTATINFA